MDGWKKNSANIWLSRIIAISKKYGWNSADYWYFFLNTAEGQCESIFQRRKVGSQCILELGSFEKWGHMARPSVQSLATVQHTDTVVV